MDESSKDQQPPLSSSSASEFRQGNGGRKSILRYPLRSAAKPKEVQTAKSPEAPPSSTASKRGRPLSSLSKSVSALELSGKEKSSISKPPRRLSIPTKSALSPRKKLNTNITPISEARTKRSANGQDKCETPCSDVSRTSTRRKFSVLTSASYWLQQIKLSESAAKHSISLGFFKLALEAGCEPVKLLREELKSYARKHKLGEHGETVKGLFEIYEISETLEQLQVSETSHVPEDATTPSDEGVQSTTSVGTRKLKPKSLNTETQASSAKLSSKKENATAQRATNGVKTRASENRNPVNRRLVAESGVNNIKKKVQKTGKQETDNEGDKNNKDEESSVKEVICKPSEIEPTLEGNKENLEVPLVGEISATGEN